MRVLVVEDEQNLGEVFKDFLLELGHEAVVVGSAEAALGQITESERPDAIILDINLPGMSGLEFLQLGRVRDSGVPIVAVSGFATDHEARECLRLGVRDFIGKPVELDRLTEMLTHLEPDAGGRGTALLHADRRRYARARIGLPLTVRHEHRAAWTTTCIELGVGGMRAHGESRLPRGTIVTLGFTLPDGRGPIEVRAVVTRADRGGSAFAFVDLAEAESRRLAALVPRLAGA